MGSVTAKIKPFTGLRSFNNTESSIFFGRERQVSEVNNLLSEKKFIAITGPSGVGKSSLIMAGIISAYVKNNPKNTEFFTFQPGEDPLGNFISAIKPLVNSVGLDNEVYTNPDVIANYLYNYVNTHNKSVLIVIDQFEEIFRFSSLNDTVKVNLDIFIQHINNIIATDTPDIKIIISLRSEYLNQCSNFPGLAKLINNGYYLLSKMERENITQAISNPLKISNITVTDEFIEKLIDDTHIYGEQMAVVQHTMMRIWDLKFGTNVAKSVIDISDYNEIGTISDSVSAHAEEILQRFPEESSQLLIEKIFKSLLNINSSSPELNKPTSLKELSILADASEKDIIAILNEFRAEGCSMLSPSERFSLHSESIIDIVRTSVIFLWKRLKLWKEDEEKSAQLYLQLAQSAELYQQGKSGLWRDMELNSALDWYKKRKPTKQWAVKYNPYFERAIAFLELSKKEFDKEIESIQFKQKSELKRARNVAILLGTAAFISIMFLILALNLKFKAEDSEKAAKEKERISVLSRIESEFQKKEAVSSKKIAEQQQQIAEQQKIITEEQRLNAIKQQEIALFQKAEAFKAQEIAENARDSVAKLQIISERLKREALAAKDSAVISANIARTAKARTDTLRRLSISKSLAIQSIKLNDQNVKDTMAKKFVEQEKLLLPKILALQAYHFNARSKGYELDPYIFNAILEVSGEKEVLKASSPHKDAVRDITVVKNGTLLITCGDDGSVKKWDLATKNSGTIAVENLRTDFNSAKGVRCVEASADAKTIIAGTAYGRIIIWLNENKQSSKNIDIPNEVINDLVLFPDNNSYLASSLKGRLYFGKVDAPATIPEFIYLGDNIMCMDYNPQLQITAVALKMGKVLFYKNGEYLKPVNQIAISNNTITTIEFKNNNELFIGTSNGIIECRNIQTNKLVYSINAHLSGVTDIQWIQENSQLITCGYDGKIRIWKEGFLNFEPIEISGHTQWVYKIALSPDNNILYSASADRSIRITPINQRVMLSKIRSGIPRNMSKNDWDFYVGADVPYSENIPVDF